MSTTFLIQNGDAVYDVSGRPQTIADNQKVRQDIAEFLSVEVQPSGFGAGIVSLIDTDSGGLSDGANANIDFAIRDYITSGTTRFIGLQRKNLKNRPTNEQISGLDFCTATQSATDPTLYIWQAAFSTLDGAFITKTGSFNL
jgi:hypothetical protein